MASSSSSSSSSKKVRLVSRPRITDPVILKIDQHLQKLRESEASSTSPMQTIYIGLTGLAGLYKCVDDALNCLPLLPRHNTNTLLVSGISKLLELCTTLKEMVGQLGKVVRELISSDDENPLEVSRYFSVRKEIVGSARGVGLRLKQVEVELMSEDRELSQEELDLTRAIRCVSIISISVLESLLHLLAVPIVPRKRRSRLSVIFRLMGGRRKEAEGLGGGEGGNDLSNVDVILHAVLEKGCDGDKVLNAKRRLEKLEANLRAIEKGLSFISSQLPKTRTSQLKYGFLQ